MKNITGSIEMENGGIISFELYPQVAPQSVRNFVHLVREGFYDGLKFHRIIRDFMVQGGCPLGDGTGDPGYSIKGEFDDNNHENDISHKRGVLSMARSSNYNSAGSQFFICHGDSQFLDGSYAAFGMVTDGMDIVDELAETPVTDSNGTVAPDYMPVIASITIDGDFDFPKPDMM
ncbi:MAG: peptidylprolyl isomerase [Oscillospiraceae bacterium]|nr:peptidylprolyl isomerase [Oscillospiraceae bacterium]